jgi:hypothetical protein
MKTGCGMLPAIGSMADKFLRATGACCGRKLVMERNKPLRAWFRVMISVPFRFCGCVLL